MTIAREETASSVGPVSKTADYQLSRLSGRHCGRVLYSVAQSADEGDELPRNGPCSLILKRMYVLSSFNDKEHKR